MNSTPEFRPLLVNVVPPSDQKGTSANGTTLVLRPVVDFLVLAVVLLALHWYFRDDVCVDESQFQALWSGLARGIWLIWLTHAAGLIDEAMRVFLGIRLTLGLGTPTSVDRVHSKMSRRAEVVAEGIAVDDFPSLGNLFARAHSSGSPTRDGGISAQEMSPTEPAAKESSVMKVERVSAVAQLWSMTPWSRVRRYERVHVKGITLRLRQFNGILNFSFLALDREKDCHGQSFGTSSMDDLDLTDTDRLVCSADGSKNAMSRRRCCTDSGLNEQAKILARSRNLSPTRLAHADPGHGSVTPISHDIDDCTCRSTSAPWACTDTCSPGERRKRAKSTGRPPGERRASEDRARSGSAAPDSSSSLRHLSCGCRSPAQRDSGSPDRSNEGISNLGVFKVLGEAFMRRFNAYAEQVSAGFDRVGDIKLLPKVRPGWMRRLRQGGRVKTKEKKRFEVGEIYLEDVCICVDAGVWNDLLGDHVGAAFSPEFRLEVMVGPQELLTPDGNGRLASEIGGILNEKLVRLLSRLVMRETLKTSTLTSMVITSLALDTDARVRQQGKNKSSSPVHEEDAGGALNRAVNATATALDGVFAADSAKAPEKHNKFWRIRSFANSSDQHSSTSSLQSIGGAKEIKRAGSAGSSVGDRLLRPSFVPPSAFAEGGSGHGPARQRRRALLHSLGSSGVGGPLPRVTRDDGDRSAFETFEKDTGRRQTGRVGESCSWSGREAVRKNSLEPMSIAARPTVFRRQRTDPNLLRSLSPPLRRFSRTRKGSSEDSVDARKIPSPPSWMEHPKTPGPGTVSNHKEDLETVAKAPSWMEEVEAYAKYDEMKPALDVIKRTVLLAVLQQSNRSTFVDGSSGDETDHEKDEEKVAHSNDQQFYAQGLFDENRVLERTMQDELDAARRAGGDVDRLVMKALLARVSAAGPNAAFKALASIEISSLLESLAAETHFATTMENVGIDVSHVARSFTGLTAGALLEGVRVTAGKVGAQAQRLRAEAVRVQKELLDETGILPLLDEAGGSNTSLTTAVETLSDTLTGATGANGVKSGSTSLTEQDSWEKGVAVSNPLGRQSGDSTVLATKAEGDDIDEVEVIMQVMDLLEAVENLKEGIMTGNSLALGKVEKAVDKAARRVDIYLILAAGESVLGFLLERLGKLPVGHAKFAGKGFESRVFNLDLGGVHVARDKVDLVMKGFRLPKRGARVMTLMGPGRIKRYKKRSRCFVVNLDWKMSDGTPVKSYLQPNDVTVLEGHEGALSDDEDEAHGLFGRSKVATVDHIDTGPSVVQRAAKKEVVTSKADIKRDASRPLQSLTKILSRKKNADNAVGGTGIVPARKGTGDANESCKGRRRRRSCSSDGAVSTSDNREFLEQEGDGEFTARSCDGKYGGRRQHNRNGDLTDSASSSLVDFESAPFLVIRITDVGADLRDVKWSVKQTHFPHLKTAGTLEATVSGLTIELELDTQALPVLGEDSVDGKAAPERSASLGGDSTETEVENARSNGESACGSIKHPAIATPSDDTPKGLKITRLRVSVRKVKLHVSDSALSGVYNLVASAFEAAVKRNVVENVEAAVRKNMTGLLDVVNAQMGEKWGLLRSVGGGAGGMAAQAAMHDDNEATAPATNAIDKVIAASMSHPVMWAPAWHVGDCNANGGAPGHKPVDPGRIHRGRSRASPDGGRADRALSSSSSRSTDSDAQSHGGWRRRCGGGSGSIGVKPKQSLRARVLGAVGISAAAESDTSVTSCADERPNHSAVSNADDTKHSFVRENTLCDVLNSSQDAHGNCHRAGIGPHDIDRLEVACRSHADSGASPSLNGMIVQSYGSDSSSERSNSWARIGADVEQKRSRLKQRGNHAAWAERHRRKESPNGGSLRC